MDGERSLRPLLIIGAESVIIKQHVHATAKPGTWLGSMLAHKPDMLVRMALANKMAWIVWAFAIGLKRVVTNGSPPRGGV